MSSIVRSDLILLRILSLLNCSSSRCRFWFKTSTRRRSSLSFFLCRSSFWRFLSNSFASVVNIRPHLAMSFLRRINFLDKRDPEFDFCNCFTRNLFGRCLFWSSNAICCRSQNSKRAFGFFSRKCQGRCFFLSCIAICRRSQRSRRLVSFFTRKFQGRLRFLSCLTMRCCSQRCKLAVRKGGLVFINRTHLL